MFKSKTQPLCRYCGKAIAKHTKSVWVKKSPDEFDRMSRNSRYVYGVFKNKADCQRYVNDVVVTSVRYHYETIDGDRTGERHAWAFNTWDRESYVDEFFCGGPCTQGFAYMAARTGMTSTKYGEAKG